MTFALDLAQAALLCATAIQLGFLRRVVRTRAGCCCSKGAISPFCPIHGWERGK